MSRTLNVAVGTKVLELTEHQAAQVADYLVAWLERDDELASPNTCNAEAPAPLPDPSGSPDAMVWAEAFAEHVKRLPACDPTDAGWLVGWFANAMAAVTQLTAAEASCSETVLEEAQRLVYSDREDDYGHPREDFTRQAIIWTGLLHHKLADGVHLEPEDIARCMIGVKLARDVHTSKRDNRVDMAGYAELLDRLETGR